RVAGDELKSKLHFALSTRHGRRSLQAYRSEDSHQPRPIRLSSDLILGTFLMARPPCEEPAASRLLSGLHAIGQIVPRSSGRANSSSRLFKSQTVTALSPPTASQFPSGLSAVWIVTP